MSVQVVNVEARTHGRVLVREVAASRKVLVGFHGYSETAEIQMDRLLEIPGSDGWTLLAVQGLHRFYRGRSRDTAAGWMTRQDRELAIDDNIEYVNRVLAQLAPHDAAIAHVGFSQGVAMAFRAAVRGRRGAAAVMGVGGDVPPELLADPGASFPRVLLCRGADDTWYTDAKMSSDVEALRARDVAVHPVVYEGGHEWTPAVAAHAALLLA